MQFLALDIYDVNSGKIYTGILDITRTKGYTVMEAVPHRLRPINTHLAYFVLCRTLIQEKIDMLNQFLTK